MKRTLTCAVAVGLLLAACGGSDDSADDTETTAKTVTPATVPASTEPAAPDTTTTPATTEAQATTQPPTVTTLPAEPADVTGTAVVWRSGVDDARVNQTTAPPSITVGGITVEIDLYAVLPADSPECEEANDWVETEGQQCLLAQARFDVPSDIELDSGSSVFVSFEDAVTAAGRQVECSLAFDNLCFTDAFPGTVDNALLGVFLEAGPGSTLRVSVSADDFDTVAIDVPGAEAFLPAAWLLD